MKAAELPRSLDAAARGRRLVSQWFESTLDSHELDSAKLVSTELINNAVLHGKGTIRLRADLDDDRLLIEVIDEGAGFEHTVREIPFDQLSGRGLAIVDAEASRWGTHEGTTHVWAELERAGPRVGKEAKPGA